MSKFYNSGYARSDRSTCRGCQRFIEWGSLRLSVESQPTYYHGTSVTWWFHEDCFWSRHRPKSIVDIANIKKLKKEDQDKIAFKIQGTCDIPQQVQPQQPKIGKKGRQPKSTPPSFALNDFTIQYSKSNRAQCLACPSKIGKGELRVAKKEFESDKARLLGGLDRWYHLICFIRMRKFLKFMVCGSELPGFNLLSESDQQIVISSLPSLLEKDPVPPKKPRGNANHTPQQRPVLREINEETMNQLNEQMDQVEVPVMVDPYNIIDLTNMEDDDEDISGESDLNHVGPVVTQLNPAASEFIPRSIQPIEPEVIDSSSNESDSDTDSIEDINKYTPFQNMCFFIHSSEYNRDNRQTITKQIIELGGKVISKFNPIVTVVIATNNGLEKFYMHEKGKSTEIMEEIHDCGIHVVNKKFIKDIYTKKIRSNNIVCEILSNNLAFWAETDDAWELEQRIEKYKQQQSLIRSKSKPKKNKKTDKVKTTTVKLPVPPVDPQSNLQNACKVGKKYNKYLSAVLKDTNNKTGVNSHYKLQLLQDKSNKSKFYLFKSWGKPKTNSEGLLGTTSGGQLDTTISGGLGTTSSGGSKIEEYNNLNQAYEKFDEIYYKQSGNYFHEKFIPKNGKMILLEDGNNTLNLNTVNQGPSNNIQNPNNITQRPNNVIQGFSNITQGFHKPNNIIQNSNNVKQRPNITTHKSNKVTKKPNNINQTFNNTFQQSSNVTNINQGPNNIIQKANEVAQVPTSITQETNISDQKPNEATNNTQKPNKVTKKIEDLSQGSDEVIQDTQKSKKVTKKLKNIAISKNKDDTINETSEQINEDYGNLNTQIIELVKFLFNKEALTNILQEYEIDTTKMPLNKISMTQINKGFTILKDVYKVIDKNSRSTVKNKLFLQSSNLFYTTIPHLFGTETPPLINSKEIINIKNQLLGTLIHVSEAMNIMSGINTNPILNYYNKLQCHIECVDNTHEHWDIIMKYVRNTNAQNNINVIRIYKIEKFNEEEKYESFSKNLNNKYLLWYGIERSNAVSILSNGLCVPPEEAPNTSYKLGKGIYFADSITKSVNNCNTNQNNIGLLLLCEVALGNMYEISADATPDVDLTKLHAEYNSLKIKDKLQPNLNESCLHECCLLWDNVNVPIGKLEGDSNEYVVYNSSQIQIKYMLQVQFDYDTPCMINGELQ